MRKKWTQKELENAIEMHTKGKRFAEIADALGRTKKSVKMKLNKLGYGENLIEYYEVKICSNINCKRRFKSLKSENRLYCSQSCSATINNSKYQKLPKSKKKSPCLNCGKITVNKYCNYDCLNEHKRGLLFEKIKNGTFSRINKDTEAKWYKKYLIHEYGEKCMNCGWGEVNQYSGKIPIELEHIDGNSENNNLDNLKLLCPNCHSLTPTYRALNVGNGRHNRRERYKNGKSY